MKDLLHFTDNTIAIILIFAYVLGTLLLFPLCIRLIKGQPHYYFIPEVEKKYKQILVLKTILFIIGVILMLISIIHSDFIVETLNN